MPIGIRLGMPAPTARPSADLRHWSPAMNPITMLPDLAADRRRVLLAEAAAHRAAGALPGRPGTVRRAIGARLVRLGETLAGAGTAPVGAPIRA